jgi:hypothetical protein
MINQLSLIEKILKTQDCYGKFDKGLKALCIIFRQKPFRTYLKISGNKKDCGDLLRLIRWTFAKSELYCKVKKNNPLLEVLKYNGFFPIGDRGSEILLVKKKFVPLRKLIPKDINDLGEEDGNHNRKNKKSYKR